MNTGMNMATNPPKRRKSASRWQIEPIYNLHRDAWTRMVHPPAFVPAWVAHGRGHGPYTLTYHTHDVPGYYAYWRDLHL